MPGVLLLFLQAPLTQSIFDVKRKLGSLSAIMGNIIFQKKGSIYIFKKINSRSEAMTSNAIFLSSFQYPEPSELTQ